MRDTITFDQLKKLITESDSDFSIAEEFASIIKSTNPLKCKKMPQPEYPKIFIAYEKSDNPQKRVEELTDLLKEHGFEIGGDSFIRRIRALSSAYSGFEPPPNSEFVVITVRQGSVVRLLNNKLLSVDPDKSEKMDKALNLRKKIANDLNIDIDKIQVKGDKLFFKYTNSSVWMNKYDGERISIDEDGEVLFDRLVRYCDRNDIDYDTDSKSNVNYFGSYNWRSITITP